MSLREGIHSETPRPPLGAEARGRICLSLSDATGEEGGAERSSVLLPASQVLQDSVNLFLFAESLKERQQVQQLCVIHVVEPGLDWHLRRQGPRLDFGTGVATKSPTSEELTAFSGWKM